MQHYYWHWLYNDPVNQAFLTITLPNSSKAILFSLYSKGKVIKGYKSLVKRKNSAVLSTSDSNFIKGLCNYNTKLLLYGVARKSVGGWYSFREKRIPHLCLWMINGLVFGSTRMFTICICKLVNMKQMIPSYLQTQQKKSFVPILQWDLLK